MVFFFVVPPLPSPQLQLEKQVSLFAAISVQSGGSPREFAAFKSPFLCLLTKCKCLKESPFIAKFTFRSYYNPELTEVKKCDIRRLFLHLLLTPVFWIQETSGRLASLSYMIFPDKCPGKRCLPHSPASSSAPIGGVIGVRQFCFLHFSFGGGKKRKPAWLGSHSS